MPARTTYTPAGSPAGSASAAESSGRLSALCTGTPCQVPRRRGRPPARQVVGFGSEARHCRFWPLPARFAGLPVTGPRTYGDHPPFTVLDWNEEATGHPKFILRGRELAGEPRDFNF